MTVTQPSEPRTSAVGPGRSIPVFYRMLLRGQLTRGRLLGLGVLAGILVLLAIVTRIQLDGFDREEITVELLSNYAISLFLPLAALIMSAPMIGNLVEDRLLVYLWLKPVPRWHLAAAAYGAVVSVLLPVALAPTIVAVLISGLGSLLFPAVIAVTLGSLAYAGIYLFLGARFTWGLWLGLLYLVLWENVVSRFSDGVARLSIRSYLQTSLERGTDLTIDLADRAGWSSIVIPLAVAVVGVALTAWTLSSTDVD